MPRTLWPDDECNEMGGEAWHATVISSTSLTAVVEFAKARSKCSRGMPTKMSGCHCVPYVCSPRKGEPASTPSTA